MNTEQLLREKELELEAVRREVEALRIVAPLLADAEEPVPKMPAKSETRTNRIGTSHSAASKAQSNFWP